VLVQVRGNRKGCRRGRGPCECPSLGARLGATTIPVGEVANQTLQVVEKVQGTMRVTADAECVFVKLVGKYAWES